MLGHWGHRNIRHPPCPEGNLCRVKSSTSLQPWRHRWGKKVATGYVWGTPDGPTPLGFQVRILPGFPNSGPAPSKPFSQLLPKGSFKNTDLWTLLGLWHINSSQWFSGQGSTPLLKPPVSSWQPLPSSPAPCSQCCHFTSAELLLVLESDWVCPFPTPNTPTPQPHVPDTQPWYCSSSLRPRWHGTLPSPPRAPRRMWAHPATPRPTAPPIHSRLLLWATSLWSEWMLREAYWVLDMEVTRERSVSNGDLPFLAIGGFHRWCRWNYPGRMGPEEIQGNNGIKKLRRNSQSHRWKVKERRLSTRNNK